MLLKTTSLPIETSNQMLHQPCLGLPRPLVRTAVSQKWLTKEYTCLFMDLNLILLLAE